MIETDNDAMEDIADLYAQLGHLAAVIDKQAEQLLQEQLGIGTSQYRILAELSAETGTKQRKLAQNLGQTEASISRQIKLLAEKNLAMARQNRSSKREQLVLLTGKGVKLTEAAKTILETAAREDADPIKPRHLQHLKEGLDELHASLCQPGRTGACDHFMSINTSIS
ncbi:MAG: MarR family transcriptional regulator [Candidatus Saccharibacteria bacterium]|nr:MarR family transcriptional regulator [Candidatus Saccharibacteria bacterium]